MTAPRGTVRVRRRPGRAARRIRALYRREPRVEDDAGGVVPFDTLAEQAKREYRAGRTRKLRVIAAGRALEPIE